MKITNRGKKWEILNSLWIIWSFVFPLNSIGFFIIGFNTRSKKWKTIACTLLLTSCIPLDYLVDILGIGQNIITPIYIISYIIGIKLSIKYQIEYLIRRDLMLSNSNKVENIEREIKDRLRRIEYDEQRGELKKNNRLLLLAINSLIIAPIIATMPYIIKTGYTMILKQTSGLILLIPGVSDIGANLDKIKQRMLYNIWNYITFINSSLYDLLYKEKEYN